MSEQPTEQATEQHHVYIALCADGSLYTGYSKNVEQRLKTHNSGKGGRYTRSHRPLELLASWSLHTKTEALRVEYAIKQLSRQQKLALIESQQTDEEQAPEWLRSKVGRRAMEGAKRTMQLMP